MQKAGFILIYYFLFKTTILQGQCLKSDSLWNRIIFLADSKIISTSDQLKELINFEISQENCPNKTDSSHTLLLSRIGTMYFKLGDYLKAVEYCRRSIHIISANIDNSYIRTKDILSGYYWLSVFYDSLSNVDGRMKAWDSCESYAIKLKAEDDISYIRILFDKVEHYFDVGDYQNCIYYAARCNVLASGYAASVANKGYKLVGTKTAESSLGWEVKTLLFINENDSAEKLLMNKLEVYKKANLKDYLGFLYGFLAEVQEQKNNYPKALFYFNKALQCYRETGNHFDYKQILKQIGEEVYFKHFNDGNKALSYFRDALKKTNTDRFESKEDITESLSILSDMADVYVQKDQYDSAFVYFQLAFDQIKPGITETYILNMPLQEIREFKKIYYLTSLVIDKGDAYMHEFKTTGKSIALKDAIRIYKNADQLLDLVRMEQSDLNSKLFWRYNTRRLYEHAIEASFENGDMTNAFYFFERSRASLLNDQLNEQHWLDEDDISRLTQIRKILLQLNTELDSKGISSIRMEEIRSEQFTKKRELDNLEQLIKSQNPLYYQSFLNKNDIGIPDVQKNLLKDHQALLELFTGDSANYSLVITPRQIQVHKINKYKFDSVFKKYIYYISKQDILNEKFEEFVSISHQLYQLIIQNNPLPEGRIIFSPGDRYFPLEALVTSNPKEKLVYFQKEHAVSYTYSARYLMSDFKMNTSTGSNDFMGVAPIQYHTSLFSFSDLIGSEQSLGKINAYFNGQHNLIGSQATKNNFLQLFSKYRIIQIYTHSSDTSSKGEPVMYFADSALYLSELIPQIKPATQLIVLSACETGLGRDFKGEGIFSFNRGFAALGIPSAITNLWSVNDKATYQLTQLFYRYLSEGIPTDVALQKAKLEFIQTDSKDRQLPYYWAAAILVGKTDVILMGKSFPWKTLIFLTITIVFSILLVLIWRNRKRKVNIPNEVQALINIKTSRYR
jgi:CHAT domain-containing protein